MARILVVEDDDSVRSFVARALSLRGHTVEEVANGRAALAALQGSERFDLMITDVVMPELDGIALAMEVARAHAQLPVLLMTGYSAERQRAHDVDEIACQIIVKPFSLKTICEMAESMIRDGRAASSPTTCKPATAAEYSSVRSG